MGTDTTVTLFTTAHGVLPAFPVLGAMPVGHGASRPVLALAARHPGARRCSPAALIVRTAAGRAGCATRRGAHWCAALIGLVLGVAGRRRHRQRSAAARSARRRGSSVRRCGVQLAVLGCSGWPALRSAWPCGGAGRLGAMRSDRQRRRLPRPCRSAVGVTPAVTTDDTRDTDDDEPDAVLEPRRRPDEVTPVPRANWPATGSEPGRCRLVVLASGSGTTLQALLDDPDCGPQIVAAGTDVPDCHAMRRAAAATGVATFAVALR